MRLDYFRFRFKRDFAFWEITKDVTLYSKPVELYNFKTKELRRFKNLDAVLDVEVDGKKIRTYIDEMDDFPPVIYDGGRGASSGKNMKSFSISDAKPQPYKDLPPLPAALANTKIKKKNFKSALKEFKKNHLLANKEFAYEVDDNGYVHQYKQGLAHSVTIGNTGNKLPKGTRTMIIHNHPGGGNFSPQDLYSTSLESRSKGIVASGRKYDYTFTKKNGFKANDFMNDLKGATIKGKDYDDAMDRYLRKNQKKYGYSYKKRKN